MLRIFSEWINTSITDFKYSVAPLTLKGHSAYELKLKVKSRRFLRLTWQALLSYKEDMDKRLLDRIDRKIKEVKSLQDGVCHSPANLAPFKINKESNCYSFLTPLKSAKPPGPLDSTNMSWSSL